MSTEWHIELIKGYKKEEKQKYQGKITQTKALQMYA
jgi:hypothetical protein